MGAAEGQKYDSDFLIGMQVTLLTQLFPRK